MYGRDLWIETHPNHDDWICHFCREQIDPAAQPRSPGSLNVHHLDGDHDNDAPENLSPAHQRCHARYHMEVRLANGYREEIGRVHRGKVVSTATRARQSAAHARRDPATKLFNILHRCECGLTTNAGAMSRHRTKTGHTSRRIDGS